MPRRATLDDVDDLAALDQTCFAAGERWSARLWRDEITAGDRLVVLLRDDTASSPALAGAATFQQVDEVSDLHRVMVHPAQRGLGLARQLVSAGAEWASACGAERMLLEVRHDNLSAHRLYEGLGFTTIHTRPDYYGAGLDAHVMQVDLPLRPPRRTHD